jgi:hypothetical protein
VFGRSAARIRGLDRDDHMEFRLLGPRDPTLGTVGPLRPFALEVLLVFNGVALLEVMRALLLLASALRQVLMSLTLAISPVALNVLVALVALVAIGITGTAQFASAIDYLH